jgi:hypothetical protein
MITFRKAAPQIMASVSTITEPSTLALLREWTSVVDSIAGGRGHVLIRKGGIAEGKDGFQIKRSFFGLLPTLFHQVKNSNPDAQTPEAPSVVSVLAQLVEAWAVPSTVSMESIAAFHGYSAEQLATRQQYKPERPLNLMIIRAFRLRQPVEIAPGQIRTVCRSWAEFPLASGMGGIDPVISIEMSNNAISDLQTAIGALPHAERIG